ncbi:MAG: DUF1697 domain-containing protein, partial [Flavobacteriales bacterium]
LLSDQGFEEVSTYIQSGNVFYHPAKKSSPEEDADCIEKLILEHFGFEVPVVIISQAELECALNENPFYTEGVQEKQLYFCFLKTKPKTEQLTLTEAFDYSPDQFKIKNKVVFLYYDSLSRNSKLSNQFFESKLKVKATTRNLKTSRKLLEISKK